MSFQDRDDAIRLRDKPSAADPTRWGILLVIFMRMIAVLWIVQGLAQWQVMLFVDGMMFDRVSASVGVAVIFFAVADLLAAVGLWLATPWGGVLWILVAFAQCVVAIVLPDFFEGGRLVVALNALLVGLYLFVTYKAANEGQERLAPSRPNSTRRSPVARLLRRP